MTKPLLLALAAGVLATGCVSSPPPAGIELGPIRPSPIDFVPSPEPPQPTVLARVARPINPLTGLAPRKVPLVVIKVDNAKTARPFQRGLNHAAVVYQELVEDGLTRFAAVYDGSWSGEVGPIRSARETDIELLAQYGRVTLAFSGANRGVMNSIHSAARRKLLIDASHETVPAPYREGLRRKDSYNFFSTPNKLRQTRPGALARDIGFEFRRLPRGVGRPAGAARVSFSTSTVVTVRYNPKLGRYAVFQDGQPMRGVAPANVIIQTVPTRSSRYVDIRGARTPYTTTIGRGNVVLLRDGKLLRGSWRRLTVQTGTRFLDRSGKDLPMKPGPTWILLQPKGMPTLFR